ncbi:MAG: serine/threonine protein kinase [Sedimentisphaerales bacterium]|nr:serine/threonine protein kinase [Sedimentisphaerales bacterium]
MTDLDQVRLDFQQGIRAESGNWYNTLQFLGRGGNAVTYLVIAGSGPLQGTPFAVKVFRRVSRPERRASFLEEVRFLRECEHPGIMRIYDEGIYMENHPFVVAEYLPRTLAEVIRSRSASVVEKLTFALQLLSALDYLAALVPQVIHRDIKPQNVFVKGRSCVLGDFGLMKRLDDSAEELPDSVIKDSVGPGMPFFYRTPDLIAYARGETHPTVKSDLFQLGLVLAELFTGRNPEKRAENDQWLSDVVLEPLGYIPGSLGVPVANLISSLLSMNPDDRPDTSQALPAWRGLFFAAAKLINAVEGRVF